MGLRKQFSNLCGPALFYFLIAMISIFLCILGNIGNSHGCVVGSMTVKGSPFIIFLVKIIFVLFWTWILALICRAGYTWISWLLVLFPFIMMVLIALAAQSRNRY